MFLNITPAFTETTNDVLAKWRGQEHYVHAGCAGTREDISVKEQYRSGDGS